MGLPATQARDSLRLVRQLLLIAVAVEVAVLAATGLWLVDNYRPSGAAAFPSAVRVVRPAPHGGLGIRGVHRNVARLAIPTALAACALVIADATTCAPGRRRMALLVAGPGLLLVAAAAGITGYLLPWDQLALRAVKVGQTFKGYRWVFGSQTRFVLVGRAEVGKGTFLRWFIVHTVVLTVAFVVLLVVALRLGSAGRGAAAPGEEVL